MSKIKFSIIIATYKRGALLKKCLESLYQQLKDYNNYEIIVTNDGGEIEAFDSNDIITEKGININYFYLKHQGPAAARNFGITVAKGEIILFLDDDSLPAKNWFAATLKAWQEFPDADGIGGCIASNESESIYCRVNADLFNWYLEQFSSGKYCSFLSTCNAGYKKSVLKKVGGFDENFKNAAGEDRDINIRIVKKGGRLILNREITVHHAQEEGLGIFLRRHFNYGKAAYIIYAKYPSLSHLSITSYFNCYSSIIKKYPKITEKIVIFLLLTFSQVATFLGYCLEAVLRPIKYKPTYSDNE